MVEIRLGDYVTIDDQTIDQKVAQLLRDGKNKPAIRWDNYHDVLFEVIGFTEDGLIIIRDPQENEVRISKRALHLIPRR